MSYNYVILRFDSLFPSNRLNYADHPQYEHCALIDLSHFAVILTDDNGRRKFHNLAGNGETMESYLHKSLAEHINR